MNDVADALLRSPEGAAVATVVAVRRSAPRQPGAKMALLAGGDVIGSVSGGCVEGAVIEESAGVLASGRGTVLRFGFSDGVAWNVGLP